MSSEIREKKILELLHGNGYISNADLSQLLNCSIVTIRSSIKKLEKDGLLERTHGGVKLIEKTLNISISPGNIFKDKDDKLRIAEKAYEYINERDTIILDDSSNSYYLAKVIKNHHNKYIIVITNSLAIACELSSSENIEVIMIGGLLTRKNPATLGELSIDYLKNLRASKAFIGVHGINPEVGITSIGSGQLMVKKALISISEEIYVLTSSHKFGGGYLLAIAPLDKIHKIITDKKISREYLDIIQNKFMNIDVV